MFLFVVGYETQVCKQDEDAARPTTLQNLKVQFDLGIICGLNSGCWQVDQAGFQGQFGALPEFIARERDKQDSVLSRRARLHESEVQTLLANLAGLGRPKLEGRRQGIALA